MNLPTQWFFVLMAIDGRAGLDRLLAAVVALGGELHAEVGYVFCNRPGNRLRVLVVDATGVWLCQRRLNRGSFIRPKAGDSTLRLSAEQMRWLCMGVDWQRLSATAVPKLL